MNLLQMLVESQSGAVESLLTGSLDADKDGSVADDPLGMARKFF